MDLAGTAIPRESAFSILLHNCTERQAIYERAPAVNRSPDMPPRTLLSSEQRTRLCSIPTDPAEMTRHYVLDADDLVLVGARRRAGNRLGFAVQLCALRHPGRVLDPLESPPAPML